MATLPDVIATYRLNARARATGSTTANLARDEPGASSSTGWLHGQELVDTMAAPYAADVVGLLKDDTSYGVAGDHGGHQAAVQEIPIVFAGGRHGLADSKQAMRSVDILPTILRPMGIHADRGMDGDGGGAGPALAWAA